MPSLSENKAAFAAEPHATSGSSREATRVHGGDYEACRGAYVAAFVRHASGRGQGGIRIVQKVPVRKNVAALQVAMRVLDRRGQIVVTLLDRMTTA